jgi:hypothetical protein
MTTVIMSIITKQPHPPPSPHSLHSTHPELNWSCENDQIIVKTTESRNRKVDDQIPKRDNINLKTDRETLTNKITNHQFKTYNSGFFHDKSRWNCNHFARLIQPSFELWPGFLLLFFSFFGGD